MVLCTFGHVRYFDDQLLQDMKNKDNEMVTCILHSYSQHESSSELSQLKDSLEATLLHYAATYGNSDIVQYLLDSKCEIDAQDNLGRSPLMLAIQEEHEDVFEVLLKANADVNLTDNQGENALKLIFELGSERRSAMYKTLLQNVSWQKIIEGITPDDLAKRGDILDYILEEALDCVNVEMMRFLLNSENAIHDRKYADGKSLLHLAVQKEMTETVKILMEHGADVDALDCWRATPLMCLYDENPKKSTETLKILKLLMSRATLITESTSYGYMQISNVFMHGFDEAIEIILQSIVDLSVTDDKGNTIMHYLARNRRADIFKLTRARKFDVNSRNKSGDTPLHKAVQSRHLDAVKCLLETGAEVDAVDDSQRTPLYVAYSQGIVENERSVEVLLLRYGADPQVYVEESYSGYVSTIFDLIIIHNTNDHTIRVREAFTGQRDCLAAAEPVIARLVVAREVGTEITKVTLSKIGLEASWVEYFDECLGQVDRMKKMQVYGVVTLLEFLVGSEKKVRIYMRNEEFVDELEKAISEFEVDAPYGKELRARLEEGIRLVELRKKTINAICWLANSKNCAFYSVAEYIIEYLGEEDTKILCFMYEE